jgi:FkbM family methyltransferase
MIREAAKTLARQVPAIDSLIRQRDDLLSKVADLERRLEELNRPIASGTDNCTLKAALARIAKRGIDVATVIDVGASNGMWSGCVEQYWPGARYHLIEAFDHWLPSLQELAQRKPNYTFTLAAAGPHDGTIKFFNDREAPFGGAVVTDFRDAWSVPMVSIDAEVSRFNLQPPFLVKLDTHGFESEIVAGATKTLADTNLFVNEFYNYQLHATSKRFAEMVVLIESLGFRCIDMFDPLWRLKDDAFWQIDMAFIPRGRPEFLNNSYA